MNLDDIAEAQMILTFLDRATSNGSMSAGRRSNVTVTRLDPLKPA